MGYGKTGIERTDFQQYVKWVKMPFMENLEFHLNINRDVEVIGGRIGNTLVLGGIGFIIMFAGALLLGILWPGTKTGWQTDPV